MDRNHNPNAQKWPENTYADPTRISWWVETLPGCLIPLTRKLKTLAHNIAAATTCSSFLMRRPQRVAAFLGSRRPARAASRGDRERPQDEASPVSDWHRPRRGRRLPHVAEPAQWPELRRSAGGGKRGRTSAGGFALLQIFGLVHSGFHGVSSRFSNDRTINMNKKYPNQSFSCFSRIGTVISQILKAHNWADQYPIAVQSQTSKAMKTYSEVCFKENK
jgi:hypothetical protein